MQSIVRLLLLLAACAPIFAAEYFPPPDKDGGWRALTDAKEIRKSRHGSSPPGKRLRFHLALHQNGGLLVVRHGYLVLEKYFGRAHRNANPDMASTGKAYTSIACGIMLHEFHDKIPDGLDTKVFTKNISPRHSLSTIRAKPTSPSASSSA
jgi:hypothetical protein